MKNLFKYFWIIALVAVTVFTITSCKNDVDPDPVIEDGPGSLTITGLEAYNDSYVIARTSNSGGGRLLAAASVVSEYDEPVIGGKIVNGRVKLKVWKFGADNLDHAVELFDFKETVSKNDFRVDIYAGNNFILHTDHYDAASGNTRYKRVENRSISFTNGVGTWKFAGDQITTAGSLTITGIPTEYNGKFLIGRTNNDGDGRLLAANTAISLLDGAVTGGTIIGGSVTLKVWKFGVNESARTELLNFNETVSKNDFRIEIYPENEFILHRNHYDYEGTPASEANEYIKRLTDRTISFTGGNGSWVWAE